MKKKACRDCKLLILKGDECPKCGGQSFVTNWKGRIIVLDASKSQIAQKMGVEENGEFAIKVN